MLLISQSHTWMQLWLLLVALASLVPVGLTVKRGDFKTCDQSGFCKRNRQYVDDATAKGSSWTSPYRLDVPSIKPKDGQLGATILKDIAGEQPVRLPIIISFLHSGVARIQIDEEKRQRGEIELRHGSQARKERYNQAPKWVIVGGLEAGKSKVAASEASHTTVKYGPEQKYEAVIHHNPFGIDFIRDGEVHIKLNGDGLMNWEHWRPKVEKQEEKKQDDSAGDGAAKPAEEAPAVPAVDESTWWDESFGGNTDSKPRGPESISLDITFEGYEHVYGIPEHAGPLSLKQTRGGSGNYDQPYRLYNTDVFEYELDEPMTLYGAIPFMQAHRKGSTVGVFWLNTAESWIDIIKKKRSANPLSLGTSGATETRTHWMSESGVLDLFIFLGPKTTDVIRAYTDLTGKSALPQYFAIAYHQSRWNYVSDDDVKDVDTRFDKASMPYDVIWLDLEYTNGKKYFTWDPQTFADPLGMQKHLDAHQRKLVVIIDPHVKNEGGYHVSDGIKSKDFAIRNKDGNIYEGWCWPGNSHWLDCFNPAASKWWQSLFSYSSFTGTSSNVFIWNDMNEPSVFNGPETTMTKDNLHHGNWEHRDIHNLNGLMFHNLSYEALVQRDKQPRRPFILTRAFFSGSQRTAAMWTGDNQVDWGHLAASVPMILAQNIAGYPFAGADVPGFFGNPSKELLTRWYQAGAFYPFFRAHAHIDTRRREPYLAGEPYAGIITQALRLRYSLLPVWYTAFHDTSVTGLPIVRPNYYVHPNDEKGFAIDDQYYIGSTGLLIKPVASEGATSVDVYIADEEPYYDYFDYTIIKGAQKTHTLTAPLDKIPLLMQGGHIFPRKDRPRRSSGLMKFDPFTLVVVLDSAGNAEGSLYVDDGETFDFRDGAYIRRQFAYSSATNTLVSTDAGTPGKKTKEYVKTMAKVHVNKIVVVGALEAWKGKSEVGVTEDGTKGTRKTSLAWHAGEKGKAAWAVVRNPGVTITNGWTIDFS